MQENRVALGLANWMLIVSVSHALAHFYVLDSSFIIVSFGFGLIRHSQSLKRSLESLFFAFYGWSPDLNAE